MNRRRRTSQAVIEVLQRQYLEREGSEGRFLTRAWELPSTEARPGSDRRCSRMGNVPNYLTRNERAMVRTPSIEPGATNMLTGAAATINRLPVPLLAALARKTTLCPTCH